jgi:hypothetical protein
MKGNSRVEELMIPVALALDNALDGLGGKWSTRVYNRAYEAVMQATMDKGDEIKQLKAEIERLRLLVAKHHELRPVEYGWGRKCQICKTESEASNAQP